MVFMAAFACRVSMHSVDQPAARRPSRSHAVGEQASKRQADRGRRVGKRLRLAGRARLVHDRARLVDDSDRSLFQRHVHPGIVLHGCSLTMLVAVAMDHVSSSCLEQPPRR